MAKGKAGAPKKLGHLTKELFETMCACQLTEADISTALGVSRDTLLNWVKENYDGRDFSTVFAEKRLAGLRSLRASAFNMAKTNPTMNIFLQKNFCDMYDNPKREAREKAEHELKIKQLELELEKKKLELERQKLEMENLKKMMAEPDDWY